VDILDELRDIWWLELSNATAHCRKQKYRDLHHLQDLLLVIQSRRQNREDASRVLL